MLFRNGNTLDCRKANIYSPTGEKPIYIPKPKKPKKTEQEKRLYRREYYRHNYHSNIDFKIKKNISGRIRNMLKAFGTRKHISITKDFDSILGCSIQFFKEYIAAQFTDDMTWDNHGSVWHLDHIIPCSYYDLTDHTQLLECFNYTNYQPLYVYDNLSKFNKIPEVHQGRLV